jgi:hypothetical protein
MQFQHELMMHMRKIIAQHFRHVHLHAIVPYQWYGTMALHAIVPYHFDNVV